jgi:hypothetical protein
MFYNIYILCHYGGTIVLSVNIFITYNDKSSLLLHGSLGMSSVKMTETICHRLRWNYNDIDVEITWRCQIGEC